MTVPTIGGRIRAFRKAAGLTDREVAARSGMSSSNVCRLEIDGGNPTLTRAYRLAQALGVGLYDLLGWPELPRTNPHLRMPPVARRNPWEES